MPLLPEMPSPPPAVGFKFTADGRPLGCPGNTVIAPLGPDHPALAATAAFRETLATSPLAPAIALTPVDSHHMTVIEGVLDTVRSPDRWPTDIALDTPLDAVTAIWRDRLLDFDPGPEPLRLRVVGLRVNATAFGLALAGEDATAETRLRRLRDELATCLRLGHRLGHGSYAFHLTLAYWIARPDPASAEATLAAVAATVRRTLPRLVLESADFCRFDDMFGFPPVLRLGWPAGRLR
jgi:hypothetical protein